MSVHERLVSIVALVTIGLGVSLVINPPLVWGFVALLIVTTCIGTDQLLRSQAKPNSSSEQTNVSLAVFVLPSLIVLGGFLFLRLPTFSHGVAVAIGLVTTALFLTTALYGEAITSDLSTKRARQARLILNLIAYVIAFALFSAIFAPKVRSILSATAILVASGLISAELLRGAKRPESHPIYVAAIALSVAQVTWALNYWVLGALTGGAILLLVFYTITNIIRSHLNGTLAPGILGEHLAVAGMGMLAVIVGGLWLR
ncbi:MAG TPA: hypothetical protein VKX96_14055 [Chloroflexota bacterium]|nr:hypothetical protein [Chloroflexota bacterium]